LGRRWIGHYWLVSVVDKGGQTVSATRFAQLTGVSRERLRTWERRFGFPAPERAGAGPRRYAVEDAARVVAVRRAAADGTPLAAAITAARAMDPGLVRAEPPAGAFRMTVELAPVPVALVSGPSPLRLEWANAALRATAGAPAAGAALGETDGRRAADQVREHFVRELPAGEIDHPPWGRAEAEPTARSVVYRLPVGPGQRPIVAIVGIETESERAARTALAAAEAELAGLRRRGDRHDRWLDALGALAAEFQHEPGPDVVGSALDILIRQTRAVDVGLATHVSGRLALHGTRRGALGACALTVAAHPQVGRALRDVEGTWLNPTTAAMLGVPADLHAAALPIAVAGEVLGLLVMVFDEVEPLDDDNRRLLAAISASVGFALLRDRLVRELQDAVSASPATSRFARRGAGAPRPGG
jgi:DNA-binding transcriptional MerR regulator